MADDDPYKLNAKQFGQSMSSIAHAQAMQAAVRDYKKEVLAEQAAKPNTQVERYDINELMKDDEELKKIHEDRIAQLQEAKERRAIKLRNGHGSVTEIVEGEFLAVVTNTEDCVVHFFHPDFERCKLMDKHMTELARKYFDCRFVKLPAQDAPFFVVKLDIQVLPCLIMFKNGVSVDRVVGFEGLGGIDDFQTSALEARLLGAGVLKPLVTLDDPECDGTENQTKIRQGFTNFQKTASDEDSDFDD